MYQFYRLDDKWIWSGDHEDTDSNGILLLFSLSQFHNMYLHNTDGFVMGCY